MKTRLVLLLALLALPLTVLRADPQSEEWITKGRAALGSEAALNAVTSVHFSGVLDTIQPKRDKDGTVLKGADGKVQTEPLHLSIDIIFQKPFAQLITLSSEKITEVTGLDDYDGWKRRVEIGGEGNSAMALLDPLEIKQLRANAWENLAFYRGLEQRGGQVQYQGIEAVDGRACAKLAFIHADNIIFTRFFELATGRLLKTVTDSGGTIVESGEIIVKGVRFPQKLLSTDRSGTTATITFSSVKVNEGFAPSVFAVPALGKP